MGSAGGILTTLAIATDMGGFHQLVDWASIFGQIIAFGIEGPGSYGGALTSDVRRQGFKLIEVSRPDRRLSRLNEKSNTLDAENAVRTFLARRGALRNLDTLQGLPQQSRKMLMGRLSR